MTTNKIRPVILAGGSGTRLWPISREAFPKQFCRIADQPSLFQQTLDRLRDLDRFDEPVIVTNERHASTVNSQLSEMEMNACMVICEPVGRDTTAAILLATELCASNDDHLMMIMPSDHTIEDIPAFTSAVDAAQEIAELDKCIVTFGIRPTHPETGFGYLQAGQPIINTRGFLIDRFLEKPDRSYAEKLIQDPHVYWNAGIFMFERSIVEDEALRHAKEILSGVRESIVTGEWRQKTFYPGATVFSSVPAISFDYAIMENTHRAAVIPTEPKWSDLGSWGAVWDQGDRDGYGNLVSGNVYCRETENSVAISDGPVIGVCGLEDVVVVANRDAVLVTSRNDPQGVKKLVDSIKTLSPNIVESHAGEDRPWGRFDSIDRGASHQVKRIRVDAGGRLSLQYHHHRAEHWIVVTGTATVTVGETVKKLNPSEQIYIPQGAVHRLENFTTKPVEIIEVQYGSYLGEDDIVRVEDVYGRDSTDEPLSAKKDAA